MKTFTIQQQFNLLLAGFPSSTLGGTMLPKVKAALLGVAVDAVTRRKTVKTCPAKTKTKTKTTRKSGYKGTKTGVTTVAPVLTLSALALAKGKEVLRTLGRKIQGNLITLQAEILCLNAKEIEQSIAFTENKGGNLSAIRQAWVALKEAVSL